MIILDNLPFILPFLLLAISASLTINGHFRDANEGRGGACLMCTADFTAPAFLQGTWEPREGRPLPWEQGTAVDGAPRAAEGRALPALALSPTCCLPFALCNYNVKIKVFAAI